MGFALTDAVALRKCSGYKPGFWDSCPILQILDVPLNKQKDAVQLTTSLYNHSGCSVAKHPRIIASPTLSDFVGIK